MGCSSARGRGGAEVGKAKRSVTKPAKRRVTKVAKRSASKVAKRSATKPAKRSTGHGALHNRARRGIPRGAAARREHAQTIYRRLAAEYPTAHCELDYTTPFELLVATILSAQCTDKRVNMVTPALFARYQTPEALAVANPDDVEDLIRTTGFFRSKTKSLLGMANAVTERHEGAIPRTMDELVRLPGVGRKTANVVLGNAFGLSEGIVVDTHVARLSARLGLTRETDAVKIESALIPLFERDQWTMLSHLLIWHGRRICDARAPRCGECVLNDICPSSRVVTG
jgi:endonuclease III